MSANNSAPPSRTQLLQTAMLASFEGKKFEDVKFWVFSRRMRSGVVDQPKSLVANNALVRKATSYFDLVLSGGFSESDLIDMDAPYPSTMRQGVDDYGYISDSDLESEDDEDLQKQPDSTGHSDYTRCNETTTSDCIKVSHPTEYRIDSTRAPGDCWWLG
ncbi:hypothetical protein GSI_03883 [Ganoderma sinense ZZ0214-1]|uniref:Uncharacterized protein n=1 Tax=Ganoderma sinense ZZ0214-1 TaxID=1077348 RepID=A0A2G8SK92_9APHY|nr:hypothetical protein GSI_03883 [Ganoderma sinense ZZ0214-1]